MKKALVPTSEKRITAAMLAVAAVMPLTASAASQINQILLNAQDTLNLVIKILMTLAFVVFLWGIVRFIAAAGNAQQIKTAKGIMLYGLIAIAVMSMLTGIILFLQTYFGISGSATIKIPQF